MNTTPLAALSRSNDPLDLLTSMRMIRAVEERILSLRKEGLIAGSVHPCIGQEVVPVAVLSHLDARDRVLSTYRGHGWALASGVPLVEFFAEMAGRNGGVNGGRGGSAYMSAPEYGFLGENSIVAGSMPIANGVAMALQPRNDNGIAVVSIGDGATNQGAAHEALVFAAARSLPVLFICENNAWSEMTPITDTVPGVKLHERVRAMGIAAEFVDGSDAQAVVAAAGTAVAQVRAGSGPYFLEVSVPRLLGHYNLDIQHYRSESDRAEHAARDALMLLEQSLEERGVFSAEQRAEHDARIEMSVDAAVAAALDQPLADGSTALDHLYEDAPVATSAPRLPSDGKELAYGLAVNRALHTEMEARDDMIMFGEDIAIPGGTFGVTRNLRKRFGERVFDTPITESAILGAAVGASMEGLRPVVEIMWSDFLFVAFDQIINQASNVRYVSRGKLSAPLVVRMQQGITPGSCAQHSQSIEALLAHVPGLRVGMPSNAADAYAMTRAAIASDDPVVLIEARSKYLTKGVVDIQAPVERVGGARAIGDGSDVLLVAWGTSVDLALDAVAPLAERGIAATVLDLRWIAPLDTAALAREFARAGHRAVVVHEANLTAGFGAEIAAQLVETAVESQVRVQRVGLPDVRVPSAPSLQSALVPSVESVVQAALRVTQ